MKSLYETDFYAWTQQQSKLLRLSDWDCIDTTNLISEIEALGAREKRELKSRLRVLLGHLLKWQYQQEKRSNSWMASIREQREEIEELLERNPSLRSTLGTAIIETYSKGVHLAVQETNLPYEAFPPVCPYSVLQVISPNFWT